MNENKPFFDFSNVYIKSLKGKFLNLNGVHKKGITAFFEGVFRHGNFWDSDCNERAHGKKPLTTDQINDLMDENKTTEQLKNLFTEENIKMSCDKILKMLESNEYRFDHKTDYDSLLKTFKEAFESKDSELHYKAVAKALKIAAKHSDTQHIPGKSPKKKSAKKDDIKESSDILAKETIEIYKSENVTCENIDSKDEPIVSNFKEENLHTVTEILNNECASANETQKKNKKINNLKKLIWVLNILAIYPMICFLCCLVEIYFGINIFGKLYLPGILYPVMEVLVVIAILAIGFCIAKFNIKRNTHVPVVIYAVAIFLVSAILVQGFPELPYNIFFTWVADNGAENISSDYIGETVAFKSAETGMYVSLSTDNDSGETSLVAMSSYIGENEKFLIEVGADDTIAIKASNGRYLEVIENETFAIGAPNVSDKNGLRKYNYFTILKRSKYEYIYIKYNNERRVWRVDVDKTTEMPVRADSRRPNFDYNDKYEMFYIEIVG